MSFNQDDADDVVVKGDDGTLEGAKITSTTNGARKELDVSASIDNITLPAGLPVAPYPALKLVPLIQFAKNGSSIDMTVDGSVTAANFDVTPPTGETWYINSISLSITDNGTVDIDNFGALPMLANGLKFVFHVDGTDYEFYNIKNNLEIAHIFARHHHMIGTSNGFLNSPNSFIGAVNFEDDEVTLNEADGDYLRIIVQDDLSGLNHLQISILGYKVP